MGVKITDNVPAFMKAIETLIKKEVLVGIPGDGKERKGEPHEGPITNSELGYIHEFGAPEANIPARPFLIPGVESVKQAIVDRLRKSAAAVLDGQFNEAERGLNAVGETAEAAVKKKITEGPFVPIKEATKRARMERKEAYKQASEKRRKQMMALWLAGDFSPLIDKGAMRDSITYVVADKKERRAKL